MALLTEGKQAPLTVAIEDAKGNSVSLAEHKGKWVVLYFYPKDNTPGCTVEAEGFRDHAGEFDEINTVVIGVSKDSGASHQKFTDKYSLNFDLWSDPDHKLMDAFGTWGEKKFMGKTYMGTSRSTFIIAPDGTIAKVYEKVKPAGHAEEVIAFLRSQQS